MARRLTVIPIVHTEVDLGSHAEKRGKGPLKAGGAWEVKRRMIGELWGAIETWAEKVSIPVSGLWVFQDGLPMCGEEVRIVDELSGKGSRNHAVLKSLMQKGARLVGTESPELLVKELEVQRLMASGDPRAAGRARTVLEQRDRFIAERIEAVLPEGCDGLLFIGAAHGVERFFGGEIEVERVWLWPGE